MKWHRRARYFRDKLKNISMRDHPSEELKLKTLGVGTSGPDEAIDTLCPLSQPQKEL